MLYWLKLFLIFFFLIFISFTWTYNSILFLLLHSEVIIIILFSLFLLLACFFNINYAVGLSLIYLIFGGMEIALNLLLLVF